MDEEGVVSFSNVETAVRFKERFGPDMDSLKWDGSFEEYKERLGLATFTNYLGALKKSIREFIHTN